jgi:hypothetical protein
MDDLANTAKSRRGSYEGALGALAIFLAAQGRSDRDDHLSAAG